MRLKQITVNKLFGVFDHTIDLNLDEHITIIHGPNGFGKTVLLQMVNGFFSGRYSVFRTYPFAVFQLAFDDSSTITLDRETHQPSQRSLEDSKQKSPLAQASDDGARDHLRFTYRPLEGKAQVCNLDSEKQNRAADLPLSYFERYVSHLERIGPSRWLNRLNGDTLGLHDVIEQFGDELPPGTVGRWSRTSEPQWFTALRNQMHVRFIQSQRLVEQSSGRDGSIRATAAIVRYSQLLSTLIQSTLAKYAEVSQSKDRTFPQRLLTNSDRPRNRDEIHATLEALEAKRESLVKAGLLDVSREDNFGASLPINDDQLRVLSIYIRDVEEKLDVFDETAAKIDLFKNIVSKLFKYKRLTIDRSNGFAFSTDDNRPLALTNLSSGEQHEIVLLSSVLLNDQPASLFLIDEPEISLHVFWQKQFLRHLVAIVSMLHVDVIIATHSPQIINNRWDLTVQLSGPAEKGSPDASPEGRANGGDFGE